MRRYGAETMLREAYSARIEAVLALRDAPSAVNATRVADAAAKLRPVVERYDTAPVGLMYRALADLAQIVGLLKEWREAVLGAEQDAQRFLTAAQARTVVWLEVHGAEPVLAPMKAIATDIGEVASIEQVQTISTRLSAVPLPVGIYSRPGAKSLRERMGLEDGPTADQPRLPKLQVAFLKFTIDGRPLEEVHHVTPGENHDIDIEVRVTRWPEGALQLIIEPVTIEPMDTYRLPTFVLDAPISSDGPHRFQKHGRFVLKVPQHLAARPFEFKYAAGFYPAQAEQPVEVIGQRVLTLEGVDLERNKLTGYSAIDERLIEIRNGLRIVSRMNQQEISDALIVASALGNYCGQVQHGNIYREIVSEPEFQRRLMQFLRADARIGAELEEHPHAAGGVADLSFRGIRLELKVESKKRLVFADCEQFVGQAVSYTVASGKRIGLLCVLDCSPKTQPPFPMQGGIGIFPLQEGDGTPVYVVTFLLQANLARPSDLSR
jgi:hypothetical protein